MGWWTQDRLRIGAGMVLVGAVVAGTAWALHLAPAQRSDALAVLGIVLSLVSVLPLVAWLERGRRVADARPLDTLTDRLAEAVAGQWCKAAHERQLLTPEPIPIHWSQCTLTVAGPVTGAVGTLGTPPAFPPLPGHTRITELDLQAGGGRGELHRLFAGLASGRIVVVGAPGAGKSGATILLVLDVLHHRDGLAGPERSRVPVPVLFTGHGWNPHTAPVQDWLRDQLVATYPLLQGRGGAAEAAALVAARDRVALILDGLDEMDEALRPAALRALSKAPFRVMVLARSTEMVLAASETWLAGAVAVHLHEVTGPEAADYLARARTTPPPAGWPNLLVHLRAHPDGVLARGLSTPLTLTLVRDTCHTDDDIEHLLALARHPTSGDLEPHLIGRVLPAAYTNHAGEPALRYTEQQARQTLTFLAQKMGEERDLAWWHIPRWAPTWPRILATGLLTGLTVGLTVGLVVGLMVGFPIGLTVGLAVGFVVGLGFGRGGGEPRRVRGTNWRAALSMQVLGRGFKVGLRVGPPVGLLSALIGGSTVGLTVGLAVGLAFWLVVGFREALFESAPGKSNPADPRQIWCNDRNTGLAFGLTYGLAYGLVIGPVVEFAFRRAGGLVEGLASGLAVGLAIGLAVGLACPQTWATTLAWWQLRRDRRVAAVGLMPFLEDARQRGILRTVGGVYQFRHATLQDYLAAHIAPDSSVSAASSAIPRASRT